MKTRLQRLLKRGTATAVAVACSAWLAGGCTSKPTAPQMQKLSENKATLILTDSTGTNKYAADWWNGDLWKLTPTQ